MPVMVRKLFLNKVKLRHAQWIITSHSAAFHSCPKAKSADWMPAARAQRQLHACVCALAYVVLCRHSQHIQYNHMTYLGVQVHRSVDRPY